MVGHLPELLHPLSALKIGSLRKKLYLCPKQDAMDAPGTRMGLKFFAMNIELEQLLHRPVDLVIEGDLLPFAEKTANRDKVLVYARA